MSKMYIEGALMSKSRNIALSLVWPQHDIWPSRVPTPQLTDIHSSPVDLDNAAISRTLGPISSAMV